MNSSRIWKIADTLRGSLSMSECAELFSVGGLLIYLSKDSRYEKIVDLHKMLRAEGNAREELIRTLQKIENEIPYFKDVFDELNVLKRLESTQITRYFYELSAIDDELEVSEWLDEVIVNINAFNGKSGTEFVTPESINKLAISILNPTKGSFYDGVSGYGGGLLEARRYAWKQNIRLKLFGQEINGSVWAISKIRLFIAGDEKNSIIKGDVLNKPAFIENNGLKKFDYVYMDAPFSMRINNYEQLINDQYNRFFYGMPSRINADFAFISHALASLRDEGRAICVVSNGALFRGGAEGRIRKNIILSDVIESVISLPSGLYESTGIPISLIVFNKNKSHDRKNKILFIQASELATEKGRAKRILSNEVIKKITDAFYNGKEIREFSTFVHHSKLVDGNLTANRYVLPTKLEIDGFGKVNFNMESLLEKETVLLKDVADLFRGYNVGSKNKESLDGKYRIVKLSDVNNGKIAMETISRYEIDNNAKIEMYELRKEDIILSIRGTVLKTAVVPVDEENLLLSQNFIGIRCSNKLNPYFLKVYLESPVGQYLLINKMAGTTIPTLSRKDIETLKLPLLSIEEQERIMQRYNEKEMEIEKEFERLKVEMMEMKYQIYKKMGISDAFSVVSN